MGRAPCCEKIGLKKGKWSAEEDDTLRLYIQANGHGSWRSLPKNAGLLRCGKSCRLRWINYLRSDLKRGHISVEEDQIILNLHATLGNKWSEIATKLPGRTDNEIKNYWNSHLSRKFHKQVVVEQLPPLMKTGSRSNSSSVDLAKKPAAEHVQKRLRGRVSRAAMKKKNINFLRRRPPPPPPTPPPPCSDQKLADERLQMVKDSNDDVHLISCTSAVVHCEMWTMEIQPNISTNRPDDHFQKSSISEMAAADDIINDEFSFWDVDPDGLFLFTQDDQGSNDHDMIINIGVDHPSLPAEDQQLVDDDDDDDDDDHHHWNNLNWSAGDHDQFEDEKEDDQTLFSWLWEWDSS